MVAALLLQFFIMSDLVDLLAAIGVPDPASGEVVRVCFLKNTIFARIEFNIQHRMPITS